MEAREDQYALAGQLESEREKMLRPTQDGVPACLRPRLILRNEKYPDSNGEEETAEE